MNRSWKLLVIVGVLVAAVGLAWGPLAARLAPDPFAGDVVHVERDGLAVDAALRPDPPSQRGDVLWLRLARDGAPVRGAHLQVEAVMPPMGAMPEMRSRADVTEPTPGTYAAAFDLEMGGSWTLEVAAHTTDGAASLRYAFTVGAPGLSTLDGDASGLPTPAADVVPAHAFGDADRAALEGALAAYADVRGALTIDVVLGDAARRLVTHAGEVPTDGLPAPLATAVLALRRDAATLAAATTLDDARQAMAPVSAALVALASADPRLQAGRRVLACPMVAGTPRWIQEGDAVGNPFMGAEMPGCHVVAAWDATGAAAATTTVTIDPVRRQHFGIRTVPVGPRTLALDVRAPGTVVVAEDARAHVTARAEGFVEELLVDRVGLPVRAGQVLLRLASPELLAAEQELIVAAGTGSAPLLAAARARLTLLGLADADVDGVLARGVPDARAPVRAPAAGVVLAKDVVLGDRVMPGMVLFELAPAGAVWVDVAVDEADLGRVAVGDPVELALTALSAPRTGRVALVGPEVDPSTRRGQVRVTVDDPSGLRPGMLATAHLRREVGPVLAVPDTAVVFAGDRRYAFVDLGDGRLEPRLVTLGARGEGWLEVTDGVREGEQVVATGVFLVAAESRLRDALPGWGAP